MSRIPTANEDFALTVGPFIGMNDLPNLSAADKIRAAYLENVYNPTASIGGDPIGRPGVTRYAFDRSVPFTRLSCGQWALTGTVTWVAATNNVTGVSTLFLTECYVGEWLFHPVDSVAYQITAVNSNTSITVAGPITSGTSAAGSKGYAYNGGITQYCFFAGAAAWATLFTLLDAVTVNGATHLITTSVTTNVWLNTFIGWANGYTNNGSLPVYSAGVVGGPIYGIAQHQRTDGTIRRLLIVRTSCTDFDGAAATRYRFLNGTDRLLLVEYNPAGTDLTRFTNVTSTTMNAVALVPTNRIYFQTFANYFVLSDGASRPRKIDATAAPYVLTNITDANYACRGPLTTYYGKVAIVDNSDAITIRWCEEADLDTGYGTGTSDNSWALRQTSADPLNALLGGNDALYCFRNGSITRVTGAMNSDFRSSGTVDAVQKVGSRSGDCLDLINDSVVFLDHNGRPQRLDPAYGLIVPGMWKRARETMRGIALTSAQLMNAWCRYDPTTNLIRIAYRSSASATTNDQMICYDAETWECVGIHKWYSATGTPIDHGYAAVFTDENSKPRFVIASGTTSDVAIYVQKTEETVPADSVDTLAAGDALVPCTVRLPKVGGEPLVEKSFDRIDADTRNIGGTNGTVALKVRYRSANADWTTSKAMTARGTTGVHDGANLKMTADVDADGRYLQVEITNDVTGNPQTRFNLDTVTLIGVVNDADIKRR